MIPVTQFILGNSDPLLYPRELSSDSFLFYLSKFKHGQIY